MTGLLAVLGGLAALAVYVLVGVTSRRRSVRRYRRALASISPETRERLLAGRWEDPLVD